MQRPQSYLALCRAGCRDPSRWRVAAPSLPPGGATYARTVSQACACRWGRSPLPVQLEEARQRRTQCSSRRPTCAAFTAARGGPAFTAARGGPPAPHSAMHLPACREPTGRPASDCRASHVDALARPSRAAMSMRCRHPPTNQADVASVSQSIDRSIHASIVRWSQRSLVRSIH